MSLEAIKRLEDAIAVLPEKTHGTRAQNQEVYNAAQACLEITAEQWKNLDETNQIRLKNIEKKYNKIRKGNGFQRLWGFGSSSTQGKVVELFNRLSNTPLKGYHVYLSSKNIISMIKVAPPPEVSGSLLQQTGNTGRSWTTCPDVPMKHRMPAWRMFGGGGMTAYYRTKVADLIQKADLLSGEIHSTETELTPQNLTTYIKRLAEIRAELQNLQNSSLWRSIDIDNPDNNTALNEIKGSLEEATTLCLSKMTEFLRANPDTYKISRLEPSFSRTYFDVSPIKQLYDLLPPDSGDAITTQRKVLTTIENEYTAACRDLENLLIEMSSTDIDPARIEKTFTRYLLIQHLLQELKPDHPKLAEAKYKLTAHDLKNLAYYAQQVAKLNAQFDKPPTDAIEASWITQLGKIERKLEALLPSIPIQRGTNLEDQPGYQLQEKITGLKERIVQAKKEFQSESSQRTKFTAAINREIISRHHQIVGRVCDIIYDSRVKQHTVTALSSIEHLDLFTEPPPDNWDTNIDADIWFNWLESKAGANFDTFKEHTPKNALKLILTSRGINEPTEDQISALKREFSEHLCSMMLSSTRSLLAQQPTASDQQLIRAIRENFPSLTLSQAKKLLQITRNLEISIRKELEAKSEIRDRLLPYFSNSEDFYDWKITELLRAHLSPEEMDLIDPLLASDILSLNVSRQELETALVDGNSRRYVNLELKAQSIRGGQLSERKQKINALGDKVINLEKRYLELFPDENNRDPVSPDNRQAFLQLITEICGAHTLRSELRDRLESGPALYEINSRMRTLIIRSQTRASELTLDTRNQDNSLSSNGSLLQLTRISQSEAISNYEINKICQRNIELITSAKEKYENLLKRLKNGESISQVEILSTIANYVNCYKKLQSEMQFIAPHLRDLATCHIVPSEDVRSDYLQLAVRSAASLQQSGLVQNQGLEAITPDALRRVRRDQLDQTIDTAINRYIDNSISTALEKIQNMSMPDADTLQQQAHTSQALGLLTNLDRLTQKVADVLADRRQPITIKKANLEALTDTLTHAEPEIVFLQQEQTQRMVKLKHNPDQQQFTEVFSERQIPPHLDENTAENYRSGIERMREQIIENLSRIPPYPSDEVVEQLSWINITSCRQMALELAIESASTQTSEAITVRRARISEEEDHLIGNFLLPHLMDSPTSAVLLTDDITTRSLWEEWATGEYNRIRQERALEGIELPENGLTEFFSQDPSPTRTETLTFLSDCMGKETSMETELCNRFQCYLLSKQMDQTRRSAVISDPLSDEMQSAFEGDAWKKWSHDRYVAASRTQDASRETKDKWKNGGVQYLEEISRFRAEPKAPGSLNPKAKPKRPGQVECEFLIEQVLPILEKQEPIKKAAEKLAEIITHREGVLLQLIDDAKNALLANPISEKEKAHIKEAAQKMKLAQRLTEVMIKLQKSGLPHSFHDAVTVILKEEVGNIAKISDEDLINLSAKITDTLNMLGINITQSNARALLYQIKEYQRLSLRVPINLQRDQIKQDIQNFIDFETETINPDAAARLGITENQQEAFTRHYISTKKSSRLLNHEDVPNLYPDWNEAMQTMHRSARDALARELWPRAAPIEVDA